MERRHIHLPSVNGFTWLVMSMCILTTLFLMAINAIGLLLLTGFQSVSVWALHLLCVGYFIYRYSQLLALTEVMKIDDF